VFSHGWLRLLPFEWDEEAEVLRRTDRLPDGRLARVELSAVPEGVRVQADMPGAGEWASALGRSVLALDEEFTSFHALCREEPGLRQALEHGQGRILRCPTVWEDLVKTLFSVNTTWRQTVAMTAHLVRRHGPEHADGTRAFPGPEVVAGVEAAELQEHCRVGYRGEPLVRLARDIVEGRVDLEALRADSVGLEEAERRLLAIRGIGPYAAANVLMLLGHYDHLPVDSWFRQTVRNAWFGGQAVADRELVRAFERFRPYRTLVFRFYDWDGAMRREVWTNEGT
jgi:3-methyladenine DNA glycosylase/8-oxoguanine DNA glycosylase